MRFFRKKPVFEAYQFLNLPTRDSGVINGIVRVHPAWIDAKRLKKKTKLFRRDAVLLHNLENGLSTVRFVMGAGAVAISKPGVIAIDYDTIDALGIDSRHNTEIALSISRASYFQVLKHFYNHPDYSCQIAMRLGIVGVLLGLLGAVLGSVSLVI
jgi:hypothetical protein